MSLCQRERVCLRGVKFDVSWRRCVQSAYCGGVRSAIAAMQRSGNRGRCHQANVGPDSAHQPNRPGRRL